VETEPPTEGIYSDDFLQRHGIPRRFMVMSGAGTVGVEYRLDVLGILERVRDNPLGDDDMQWLHSGQFKQLFGGESVATKVDNIKNFYWGVLPLIRLLNGFKKGSYSQLEGGKEGRDPSLLEAVGFDPRGVVATFRNDEVAKRALGVILQMDSRKHDVPENNNPGKREINIPGMSAEDLQIVRELGGEYMEWLNKDHLKYNQTVAVIWMKDFSKRLAGRLSCDIGTVEMMFMFATMINGGPVLNDDRSVRTKHKGLLDQDPYDRNIRPLVHRIFIRRRESPDRRKEPSEQNYEFLGESLNHGGVDEMFTTIWNMDIKRYHQALQQSADTKRILDEALEARPGKGIGRKAKNVRELREILVDMAAPLRTPEVPLTTDKIFALVVKPETTGRQELADEKIQVSLGEDVGEFLGDVLEQWTLGLFKNRKKK
jgi:hypothetical protein